MKYSVQKQKKEVQTDAVLLFLFNGNNFLLRQCFGLFRECDLQLTVVIACLDILFLYIFSDLEAA